MSFFKKLKEKLTRSSSKLDEDLGELFEGGDETLAIEDAPKIEIEQESIETPVEAETIPEPAVEPVTKRIKTPEPEEAIDAPVIDATVEPTQIVAPPAPNIETPKVVAPKKKRLFGLLAAKEETAPEIKKPAISETDQRKHVLDDAMLEGLEETLIMSDIGGDMALKISAALSAEKFGKTITLFEMKTIMAREMAAVLEPVARPMPLGTARPQVVLVVGVNGSGKTTTIGKLALQFKGAGKSVMVAACDTFRAAAVEQLAIWGERAGVPVMRAEMNSDPASLAYDAMKRATDEGIDILMVDTAGRL